MVDGRHMEKKDAAGCSLECSILTLEVNPSEVDNLAAYVRDAWQADVVELQRPGHSSVWLEIYFDSDVEALLAGRALFGREGILATSVRPLRREDWRSFWKSHFQCLDVGRHLNICPDWERDTPVERGRCRVVIRPGIGFGTGEHFSTRFCLEMIDGICDEEGPPRTLLDVGTGSGILALAAARLGVEQVTAIDNDPQALDDARANLWLNRLSPHVELKQLELREEYLSGSFDLVCANVFTAVLVDIAPMLTRIAAKHLVLAGIREQETEQVAEAYLACGAREVVRDGDGAWSGLMFRMHGG